MSEGKAEARLITMLGLVLSVLILTLGSCEMYERGLRAKLISNGLDPIKYACMTGAVKDPKCLEIGNDKAK